MKKLFHFHYLTPFEILGNFFPILLIKKIVSFPIILESIQMVQ